MDKNEKDNLNKEIEILKNNTENLLDEIKLFRILFIQEFNYNFSKKFCPICGTFSEFLPGPNNRLDARCPTCDSLERHRLIHLLFNKQFKNIFFNKDIKLLHFAPEEIFHKFFTRLPNIDYYPVDLFPENFQYKIRDKVNMESIIYEDNMFDVIYNSHVLEHVPNDIAAMNELYRVLKPGGYCITLVPINFSFKETLEKEEYNTPELRKKYYGQEDHLRFYSMDVVDKLESVGFKIDMITTEDILDFEIEKKIYNIPHDVVFICRKE